VVDSVISQGRVMFLLHLEALAPPLNHHVQCVALPDKRAMDRSVQLQLLLVPPPFPKGALVLKPQNAAFL